MAGILVDAGKNFFANRAIGLSTAANLKLKLYASRSGGTTPGDTPESDDELSDYTLVSGDGYADKTLTDGATDWTVTNDVAAYTQQDFSFTASKSVKGYLITDSSDNLLAVEAVAELVGTECNVIPKIRVA